MIFKIKKVSLWLTMVAVVVLTGCATMTFNSYRENSFINMDAERIRVEYGKEKRTYTSADGLISTFDNKVRITLESGKRVVLYQDFSPYGTYYVSKNKRYEFIERGLYCLYYQDGAVAFEGVHCRN